MRLDQRRDAFEKRPDATRSRSPLVRLRLHSRLDAPRVRRGVRLAFRERRRASFR